MYTPQEEVGEEGEEGGVEAVDGRKVGQESKCHACRGRRDCRLRGTAGLWRSRRTGEDEGGAAGHADLGHRPLTLWDLDGSTTESAQQVGDDVVFDLVLGEPGEHGEQPKHHSFDLG